VVYRHQSVDLATCKRGIGVVMRPKDEITVRTQRDRQSIVFKGKVVLTIRERRTPNGLLPGPLFVDGLTPDRKWILYSVDPYGSASIPADGLQMTALPVNGGRSHTLPLALTYADYRAWCGNRLVMTAGGDRIAVHAKRLIVTGPPNWTSHRLVPDPRMSFGSLVCDGGGVIVQAQPSSTDANFFHTQWSLYRVGLDGSMTQLTHPPAGYADESPQVAGGVVYFVRSSHGNGKLYALQGGRLVGPLLSLGYSLGFYGHQAWPYTVTR